LRRLMLVLAAASLVLGAGVAVGGTPSPDNPAGAGSDILGVVPTQAGAKAQAAKAGGGGNLVYHGGKILTTNKTVTIFWLPTGSTAAPGYVSTINQYFADVAAASGHTDNVYGVETQYTDSTGAHIQYASAVGGSATDFSAYPASGCSDTVAATTVCLSDGQIKAEVQKVIGSGAVGAADANTTYFVFTAKNVGSCYASGSCAFSSYCAYHSNVSVGGTTVQYANQPYTETVRSSSPMIG